jgi:hypothetical protein
MPLPNRFDRIRAKVTRAEQHVQDFNRAVIAFRASNPYEVGIKIDSEAGERVYYLASIGAVPPELAAIAADVLQNLRSSLDHIVYQLFIDANPLASAEDLKRCHYPITAAASEYGALRSRNVKGVRQDAIDAIDATEPYKGGRGHALWQLSQLNNTDKHHLLIAVAFYFEGIYLSSLLDSDTPEGLKREIVESGITIRASELQMIDSGYEFIREPINMQMHEDFRPRFDISLNHPRIIGCEPALKTLQDFSHLIGGIIESFAPFFS